MLVSGFGGLKTAVGPAFSALTTGLGSAATAEGGVAAGASTMWTALLGPVGIAIAAITALGVALFVLYERSQAEQKEIDEMNKAAAALSDEAQKTKERVQDLKDSLNSYDSAGETLNKCVVGSQKWNESL